MGIGSPEGGRGVSFSVDTATLLTIFLVLRLAIPSQLSVPGLRSVGSPALLFSLAILVLWAALRAHRGQGEPSSPVLLAALVFTLAYSASLVAALLRPISSEELNSSVFGVLTILGWFGVLALAHDGLSSRERLQVLLNRVVIFGALLAALGLIQFLTGQAWVDRIEIPGLTKNGAISAAFVRDRFTRPSGTAIHPIEFGAVLSMVLPLAIVRGLGRLDPGHKARGLVGSWAPAALIAMTILLSSSRSAWIGMALGFVCLLPIMSPRQRVTTGLLMSVSVIALFVLVPGMLGVVAGMFTDVGNDPSIRSRVGVYAMAVGYIGRSPWLGRGLFTFLPRYQIFDNQYLLSVVETGIVGTGALVILAVVVAATGTAAAFRDQPLSAATVGLTTGCVVGAVELSMFDGFSFPMMAGLWFMLLGLVGACYRVTRDLVPLGSAVPRRGHTSDPPSGSTAPPRPSVEATPPP